MFVEVAVDYERADEVVAGVGSYTAVVAETPWQTSLAARVPDPARLVIADSLEDVALDRLVEAETTVDSTVVVGVGGGLALDVAKVLALRTGKDLVLVPTALSSLAPFTIDAARRTRRQVRWLGDIAAQVVVDLDLVATAPPARNRAGAADVIATAVALWDWRLADARDRGLPVTDHMVAVADECRSQLSDAAADVAAVSRDGLAALARVLEALGRACARAGHRRLVDGSEHTFAQAIEHRLGRLPDYGATVGMCSVAMASLQEWYGVSAGGGARRDEVIDLLTRCGVAANPHQLDFDEGTFRGLLRHAVRFHVGEFLSWSVLNEADVNWTASEELWRQCWRVPVFTGDSARH